MYSHPATVSGTSIMPLPILLRTLALAAAVLPVAAEAHPAYVTDPVPLHAGPGPDYPQVSLLLAGTEIEVTGCLQGHQWCDVITPHGLRGWVWSGTLSVWWSGEPLPLIQYGPSFGIPVVSFIIGDYWFHHYRDRPWYGDRHHWRPAPPAIHRHPGPSPGWQPEWHTSRDHAGEPRGQDGWRREGPRDYHPPRPDRAPRQEPRPPSPPTGSTPPPTPGGWGPSQHAPRHGVPQMDVPRAPSEPPSRFRPPPSGGMRGENGNGQGRGPENRFGGRQ